MPATCLLRGLLPLLLLAVAPASAASDVAAMLNEADQLRSADRARFGQLMDALGGRVGEATEAERQRIRYLAAYRKILYQGQVDAGIADAVALFGEADDHDLKFRAGSLAANSLAINRGFTESLRLLAQTLPMRGQVEDRAIRHDGTITAAAVYNRLGQYALGLKYADEVVTDTPVPRAQCMASVIRFESRYHLGILREEPAVRAAIQQCVAARERLVANFGRITLALHLANRGAQDEAIKLLGAHVGEVEDIGYAFLIAEYRSLLADLHAGRGDLAAAERHARAALARETDVASARPVAVAHRILYQIAEGRGDLRGALNQYRRYAEAEQAWTNEAQARELAYQMVRHEIMQQTQQIDLLNEQNSVLQLRQRVQEKTAQNTRLVVVILLLVVAFVSLWAYRTRRLHASLRRMAELDALTEICNRRHFTRLCEQALAQAARSGEEVALIMFDLDHFKSINDSYGHGVGDWVLKMVAEVCRPMFRGRDAFGRMGGEEFAVMLPGFDLRDARRLADDIRCRLAAVDTSPSGHAFQVTASFGVATSRLSGRNLTRLLSNADRMLYRAKRRGRNRVCQYDSHADHHVGDGADVPPPSPPGASRASALDAATEAANGGAAGEHGHGTHAGSGDGSAQSHAPPVEGTAAGVADAARAPTAVPPRREARPRTEGGH